MFNPQSAIIAVTYKCNSRCLTCNIWKKTPHKEAAPAVYKKLPSSLIDINITGGEPFLRDDLPEIIKIIKNRCPKSRIIINSNGLSTQKVYYLSRKIVKIDPRVAIRISIDGWTKIHNQIRGLPKAFYQAKKTLRLLKKIPIKDLGVSYTLIDKNKNQMLKVFEFCQKNNLQFSLTVATDSTIYFGKNKEKLRPKINTKIIKNFSTLEEKHFKGFNFKNWLRGWFIASLKNYLLTGKRPFSCDAARNFFYLDPQGKIFTCHLKNWQIGNIKSEKKISWRKLSKKISQCNDCLMICTAKTAMLENKKKVIYQTIIKKITYLWNF
jgi:MoaA/NifB/PqqE/SkfB family radical SAM enzyme